MDLRMPLYEPPGHVHTWLLVSVLQRYNAGTSWDQWRLAALGAWALHGFIFSMMCLSVHVQVVMPNTACDGANATRLYKVIGDQFPTSNLVTVQRRYFNETKGELVWLIMGAYFTMTAAYAMQCDCCSPVCAGCACFSLQVCSTSNSCVSPSSTV